MLLFIEHLKLAIPYPVILVIVLNTMSQVTLKWRINQLNQFQSQFKSQFDIILKSIFDPIILVCIFMTFISGLTWIYALSKFNLNLIYPFIALTYVLILFLSYTILNEPYTTKSLIGSLLIVVGVFLF